MKNIGRTENFSLKNSIRLTEQREALKQERLNKFRKDLQILAMKSLDSLKICTTYFEMSPIRHNFKVKARQLYENQLKNIEGEDITPQLFSILNSEIESAEKAFSQYIPD